MNISSAGAQARIHARQDAGSAPDGTSHAIDGAGNVLPAELRAGLASTPSASVLNEAAAASQMNPSAHFSSAGAQARAAAAGGKTPQSTCSHLTLLTCYVV